MEVSHELNLRSERKVQFVHQQLQICLPWGIPGKVNTIGIGATVNVLLNGEVVDKCIGLPVKGRVFCFL